MTPNRRSLYPTLAGLGLVLCAPAIVRATSLMPVSTTRPFAPAQAAKKPDVWEVALTDQNGEVITPFQPLELRATKNGALGTATFHASKPGAICGRIVRTPLGMIDGRGFGNVAPHHWQEGDVASITIELFQNP